MPADAAGVMKKPAAGMSLKWNITVSPDLEIGWQTDFFHYGKEGDSGTTWGWGDVVEKDWAEAVREGSPHFPGGRLEVKANVKQATKEQ